MHANPETFFLIREGAIYAWDYRRHQQFELDLDHFAALVDPLMCPDPEKIVRLIEGELLVPVLAKRPWTWDALSEIFHIGTSAQAHADFEVDPREEAHRYLEHCTAIADDMPGDAFSYSRGEAVAMPEPEPPRAPHALRELLEQRITNRAFTAEPVALAAVREVLQETFRYRDHDQEVYAAHGLRTPTRRRSSPSGGSLQSCEAYLVARRVDGLAPGIYHYWSGEDKLGLIAPLPEAFSFGRLNAGQMFSDDLSAGVFITCRFDKLAWKYAHSRAYRVALLDAGHLSQTFQLVATACGLRTWLTGMFFDEDVRRLLLLPEESQEYPLLSLGLGTGPRMPLDRHTRSR